MAIPRGFPTPEAWRVGDNCWGRVLLAPQQSEFKLSHGRVRTVRLHDIGGGPGRGAGPAGPRPGRGRGGDRDSAMCMRSAQGISVKAWTREVPNLDDCETLTSMTRRLAEVSHLALLKLGVALAMETRCEWEGGKERDREKSGTEK